MPNGGVEIAGVAVFWKWAATALFGLTMSAAGYVVNDVTKPDVDAAAVVAHFEEDGARDAAMAASDVRTAAEVDGLRALENAHFEELIRRLDAIDRRLPGGRNE